MRCPLHFYTAFYPEKHVRYIPAFLPKKVLLNSAQETKKNPCKSKLFSKT